MPELEAEAEAEAEAHHPIDVAPDPVHQAGAIAPRVIPAADPTAEAPHAPTIVVALTVVHGTMITVDAALIARIVGDMMKRTRKLLLTPLSEPLLLRSRETM
jgi:hypothetical protein